MSAEEASASIAPELNEMHKTVLNARHAAGVPISTVSRHILIPVDDTDDSEAAVNWAVNNLYKPGDAFHLMNVIPEPTMVHVWAGVYIPPDEDAELIEIEDTKDFVKHRFVETLIAARIPFQLHVILGPTDSAAVAGLIEKKVKDLGAEAVVMARHSKGKLKEYWAGSVTKSVIKRVTVPVAVVPHEKVHGTHSE